MIRRTAPLTALLALSWIALHVYALVLSGRASPPGTPWWAWGAPDAGVLVRMGAEVPSLVRDGDVQRLLTAAFLHGFVLHLAFNVWVWFAVGGTLERLVGSARLLLVFLAAALSGGVAHLWLGAGTAVGASGGVFGAVGALGVWALAHRGPEAKRLRRTVLAFLILSAFLFLLPDIAHEAHAGGFLGGAAVLLLLGPRRSSRPPGRALRAAAAILAVATVALLAAQVRAAARSGSGAARVLEDAARLERLARRLYDDPRHATPAERADLGRRIDALVQDPGLEDEDQAAALRAWALAWRPVAEGDVPDPFAFEAALGRARAVWRPVRDRLRREQGLP